MSASGHSAQQPGFRFVIVVASLGGLPVVRTLLEGLPDTFSTPVLVVQHRASTRPGHSLAQHLQRHTPLPVRAARPGSSAWTPGVTVIPAHSSAMIGSEGRVSVHPATASDMGGDALLSTAAAAAFPKPGIGIILSGRLSDGANGVRSVKKYGGRVLVQDPATAQAPGMPSSVIATGCVDFVLPPRSIAPALVALTMAPGGAELLTVPTPHWASLATG